MPEALIVSEQVYAGEAADFFLTRPVVEMDTYEKGAIALIRVTAPALHFC